MAYSPTADVSGPELMRVTELTKRLRRYFPLGIQLSAESSHWLGVESILPPTVSEENPPDLRLVRQLADRLNEKQRGEHQNRPVHGGDLLSAAVITDVLRYVAQRYTSEEHPGAMRRGRDWLDRHSGSRIVHLPTVSFVEQFPPQAVARLRKSTDDYLAGREERETAPERVSIEMSLLRLNFENRAMTPLRPLFRDERLRERAPYERHVYDLERFFTTQPVFAPIGSHLFECLRAPFLAAPDSLEDQLAYIRTHWASFLPEELLEMVLLATDILREERLLRGLGPGSIEALEFGKHAYGHIDYDYPEPDAFSRDADWMSNVVLMAKSTLVWLDQLSRWYKREIRRLDQIPDDELDRLSRWGFSGLWLIGIWERSPASSRIKQITGNPEAAASAYSLFDYEIAHELGGYDAYMNLRDRAWRRGIRLASDMVPNHVGIYSRWVTHHPDWFVQLPYSPYPSYRFTGEDLSHDERVRIQIEDGYWDRRDAAVVFQRVDKHTGDVRFIYHGNDGTSMPWNDTAQLNFLNAEVREAVIQSILHVARMFPIIRFDAAMTLAKKHYQRLWFPQPGDGGAIPSRAEHSMTREEFEQAFPKEFWREVVDRVAAEVPDTLLLAEAFWLMEGYFVRTLGMHRVYNSAFMNMLKMEDNAKYRTTIRNVLEFSPEIIKRFVNFMNNPDERTAIDQFGKGDKYFGVALMMVTMPGLPMFGHGQVEGFTEKYGMEYRRAYWEEQPDDEMVRRHEREIFPLMRRRHLFSGAGNFALYDFISHEGWVDENVFAYSNRAGDDRAVIIYNNAYNTTAGWIQTSTAINRGSADRQDLVRINLADALALRTDDNCLYAFRDHRTGLEYLRRGGQIAADGLFAVLQGYQYHAFVDFREIWDTDGSWHRLCDQLGGSGVPDLYETYREQQMAHVLGPFSEALSGDNLHRLVRATFEGLEHFEGQYRAFLEAAARELGSNADTRTILATVLKRLKRHKNADATLVKLFGGHFADGAAVLESLRHVQVAVELLLPIAGMVDETAGPDDVRRIFDNWLLVRPIANGFREFGTPEHTARQDAALAMVVAALANPLLAGSAKAAGEQWQALLRDDSVRAYLFVNQYDNELWCNREQLERLLSALINAAVVHLSVSRVPSAARIEKISDQAGTLLRTAEQAGYRLAPLSLALTPSKPTRKRKLNTRPGFRSTRYGRGRP